MADMENKKHTQEELNEILKLAFERENNIQLENDLKESAKELGISEEEFKTAQELYYIDKKIAEREVFKKQEKRKKLIIWASILAVLSIVIIYFSLPRGAYQGKFEVYLTTNEKNFLYYGGTENIQEFYALENKSLTCQLQLLEPQYRTYKIDYKLFTPKGKLHEERNNVAYRYDKKDLNFAISSFGFYGFEIKSENLGDWRVEVWVDKKLLHTQKISFKLANPHLSIGLLPLLEWDKKNPPIIKNQFSLSQDFTNKSYRLTAKAEFLLRQTGIFTLECTNPEGKIIASKEHRLHERSGYRAEYNNNFIIDIDLHSLLEKNTTLGKYKLSVYGQDFGKAEDQRIKIEEYAFEITK
ncbi:hypothetical protein AD998_06635 [bacterium 336/3]|nr:hypothetical protein AD998_06635 [bacterium 336/3]